MGGDGGAGTGHAMVTGRPVALPAPPGARKPDRRTPPCESAELNVRGGTLALAVIPGLQSPRGPYTAGRPPLLGSRLGPLLSLSLWSTQASHHPGLLRVSHPIQPSEEASCPSPAPGHAETRRMNLGAEQRGSLRSCLPAPGGGAVSKLRVSW